MAARDTACRWKPGQLSPLRSLKGFTAGSNDERTESDRMTVLSTPAPLSLTFSHEFDSHSARRHGHFGPYGGRFVPET